MLFVLTGVRGAGKTTLIERIKQSDIAIILQPSTTRPKRFDNETEYDFVNVWNPGDYAWSIEVGPSIYGMRKSEIEKSGNKDAFTVFDPISIEVFEKYRSNSGADCKVIGLDTVKSLEEQYRRVGMAPARMMSQSEFELARNKVLGSEYVLRGDIDDIFRSVCALLKGDSLL